MPSRTERRYQVFISSTKADLEPERAALYEALQGAEYIPAGMELFPSTSAKSLSVIRNAIHQSDYYVVIVGSRYGSLLPSGQSFTEYEYRYATRIGKHPIAFIPSNFAERVAHSGEAVSVKASLRRFVASISGRTTPAYYTSPADLAAKSLSSLAQHVHKFPTLGWVRGDTPGLERIESNSNQRIAFYQTLRASARRSAFVFGVGMRSISHDLDALAAQLDAGQRFRLMCVDPLYIRSIRAGRLLNHFYSSSARDGHEVDYLSAVDRAVDRLKAFITSANCARAKGSIEFRTYRFFPTTNMTCIDEATPSGRMVFEFVLQGNLRIMMPHLSASSALYRKYLDTFEQYWMDGDLVARNR